MPSCSLTAHSSSDPNFGIETQALVRSVVLDRLSGLKSLLETGKPLNIPVPQPPKEPRQ
jgi:hypothetical protein